MLADAESLSSGRSRSGRGSDSRDSKARDRRAKKEKQEKKSHAGDADRIITALNASLGGIIEEVKTQVGKFNQHVEDLRNETRNEFNSVKENIRTVEAKQKSDSERIDKLEQALLAKAADHQHGVQRNAAGQTLLSEQHLLPLTRRQVVFVGGYPEALDKDVLIEHLKEQTMNHAGIEDVIAIGSPSNKGKLIFHHCDDMWNFLKGMKGKKLMKGEAKLFHTIDKTTDELQISNRVYKIVKAVKESAMGPLGLSEEDWWKTIKHNDVNGMAWVRMPIETDGEPKNVQIVKLKPGTTELQAGPTIMQHLHRLGNLDLAAKILEVNAMHQRRDQEMV